MIRKLSPDYRTVDLTTRYVAHAIDATPYIAVYRWIEGTGYGSKFANPSVLPKATCKGVKFHPSGQAIFVWSGTSPDLLAYKWSDAGFGGKYADPVGLTGSGGLGAGTPAVSPDGRMVLTGNYNSQYIVAIPFTLGDGFGAPLYIPPDCVAGTTNEVSISKNGKVAFRALNAAPYIEAWHFDSINGFGAKYANPATALGGNVLGMELSPDGSVLALSLAASPYIAAYQWSDVTGFGTKYANPSSLSGAAGARVCWSLDSTKVFLPMASATRNVCAYEWTYSGGFGTKYVPAIGMGGISSSSAREVCMSKDGETIFSGFTYPQGWQYSAATAFGVKLPSSGVTSFGTGDIACYGIDCF